MSGEIVLHYWNIKARNYPIVVIAKAGNIPLHEHHNFPMAELKPQAPFHQFPLMDDGDIRIAQSGSILRYVAAKANLDGRDNMKDFANNDMFIEEYSDMYALMAKAQYDPEGSSAGYAKTFGHDGAMRKQLDCLEILLEDGSFSSKGRILSGDYAIACILDLINDVDPTVLDTYPKLKVFREDMLALPAFDGIKNYHAYFKRSSP